MKIHHRSPRLWRIPVSGRPCCPNPSASKLRWWMDDFQILWEVALGQNLICLVNIKIAGIYVSVNYPLPLIIIGFDTHPIDWIDHETYHEKLRRHQALHNSSDPSNLSSEPQGWPHIGQGNHGKPTKNRCDPAPSPQSLAFCEAKRIMSSEQSANFAWLCSDGWTLVSYG